MASAAIQQRCQYCGHGLIAVSVGGLSLGLGALTKQAVLKLCRVCDAVCDVPFERPTFLGEPRSQKCVYCETAWPPSANYASCPTCREVTLGSAVTPIPDPEAEARATYARFGWHLWDTWTQEPAA